MITNDQKRDDIRKEYYGIPKSAAQVTSNLVKEVDRAELFLVWMHNNILNESAANTSNEDKAALREQLAPLFPQVDAARNKMAELFAISSDDEAVHRANFEAYVTDNPELLAQAVAMFER